MKKLKFTSSTQSIFTSTESIFPLELHPKQFKTVAEWFNNKRNLIDNKYNLLQKK